MGRKEGAFSGLENNKKVPLIFGIPEDVFMDSEVIKVIDGIAGSGKSSAIDRFFKERDIEYGRYTSTNKLKRDAENRYGGHNYTIASGLFLTKNGVFYKEEKNPLFDNIVIDEILQADEKTIDWIYSHRGRYNIIVCTDSCQMLAPDNGESMLDRFNDLCKASLVVRLTKTLRPRTKETEDEYMLYYNSVIDGNDIFRERRDMYKQIDFCDITFSKHDVYICHTNEIENELFHRFRIQDRYDIPLIPKGRIASRIPKDMSRYPIVSQSDSKNLSDGYLQPERIGTPTRYQGSEVDLTRKLYYIIEHDSKISQREIYTVISRLYDIDNLIIVYLDVKKQTKLTEFNGKPVKTAVWYQLDEDIEVDGKKISDYIEDGRNIKVPSSFFSKIIEKINQDSDVHYRDNAVMFRGYVVSAERKENKPEYNTNILTFIRREPDFKYKYMSEFMRCFEISQRNAFGKMDIDYLMGAMPCYQETYSISPFPSTSDYLTVKNKRDYKYGLDFKSSYAHILNNAILPTGRIISREPGAGIDWYIVYCDQCGEGALVTHEFIKTIRRWTDMHYYFVCSTGAKIGSQFGRKAHEMSHKDKESNDKLKMIKWGIIDRQYIEGYGGAAEPDYYVIDENNVHQLLMMAIKSKQTENILNVRNIIYGDLVHGRVVADGIYFDTKKDICEIGETVKQELPGYDFRIFVNSEEDKKGEVVYRSYNEIISKEEKKAILEKKRRKKY